MTSSVTSGERRWASARRGGMTVLGKVAVPKPINLPSQRLENHGLDPNVEIVPKGTLSWGSRPSSAGSNAWGTSSLSPRTDGSSSSPSHFAGRPSSGGGTRPSTAGSERACESNVSAWASNSRPSSASGILASNSSSLTSLRPRSAETRPGSSQLSRFAEPSAEGSAPRASNATSEQMGVATAGNDGFSLSSGDFPTLGSEKDESGKNTEALDCIPHGRPGSSSGRVTTSGENVGTAHGDEISKNPNFKGSPWRKDAPPYVEDGPRPGMERWHVEPPPYPNHNMGPPHYESWRGAPPINPPGGVWYRGPPGPPPYGAPGAPGGFHLEPFPYYRPQVPPPGLANSQPIPPGAGPHGHHPKNGDMYRPPMPDSYMRPSMPMRPGFYPGPVPYEGYYGPPMGFCNPKERDLPFMGMPPGPPIYSRPVSQNGPDPNNSRPRSREHRGPEQAEPVLNDPRGNYKVLMKQNDSWSQSEEERRNHRMTTSASNRDKGILSRSSVPENAWADDSKKDQDMHFGKSVPAEEVPSQTFEDNFGSTESATSFPLSNVNETDRSHVTENAPSPRDHSLIQKIEGLNAKARASGGRQDGFHREQPPDNVCIVNAKANGSGNDATSDVLQGRHYAMGVSPGSQDVINATVEKTRESAVSGVTAVTRPTHGVQSRSGHQAKGRFNAQEADRRMRKSESHTVVSATVSGSITNDEVKEHHLVLQPAEAPKPDVERKDERASVVSTFDHSDTQRAKMREMAKQRAIQLQKEEEERTREQKAKALAKLEELNRRSANQGMENQSQTFESVPSQGAVSHKQEDSKKQSEPNFNANQTTESGSVSSNNIGQMKERNSSDTLDSAVSHSYGGAVTNKNADKDYVLLQNQLEAADPKFSAASGHGTAPAQVREASKQKRVVQKQRQNVPSEKSSMQESMPAFSTDKPKDQDSIASADEGCCTLAALAAGKELKESALISDSSVHHKKKNNKSGKNKHKVEESSNAISSSEDLPKDFRVDQDCPDDSGRIASDFVNSSSTHSSMDAKDAVQFFENHSLLSREDAHVRQSNSWKPQHSRKTRSSQNNRVSERSHGNDGVVWAPVRSNNKVDVTEQTGEKTAEPSVHSETGNNVSRNSSKTKRAEMERYVPKPVAKELAQQGNTQQIPPPPPTDLGGADGTSGTSKTPQGSESSDCVAKVGSVAETKHVDGRHKQQKAQGSWRQRVPAQSTPIQYSQDNSSSTADMSNHVKSNESRVGGAPSGPDVLSDKGPQASMCDGWDCANDPNSTLSAVDMKVHPPSGRGKRHPSKGYRGSGYNQNFDRKDSNVAFTDSQCRPGTIQAERVSSPRDSRAVGDRSTSQWQPKSQGHQGNRHYGGQDVTDEDSRGSKRETGHNSVEPNSEDKHSGGISSLQNEDSERDKKAPSFKGRPNQGSALQVESASSGATDGLNEQRPSSGYRKNANYGGRPNRGHEYRGDWNSTSQENKQNYSSANRERQRQTSHYEYQAVGPYNNATQRSNESGAEKDNQAGVGVQRFRERGNNYSRRVKGNFYGRQSGNPSDAGY